MPAADILGRELMLGGYRSDPLALNGVMYRFNRTLSSDLADQILAKHGEAGLKYLPPGWLDGLADDLVAVSLAATEALFEGRGPTVEQSARRLAVCATAMVQAVIQANLKTATASN